jgi:hypothetical protein
MQAAGPSDTPQPQHAQLQQHDDTLPMAASSGVTAPAKKKRSNKLRPITFGKKRRRKYDYVTASHVPSDS